MNDSHPDPAIDVRDLSFAYPAADDEPLFRLQVETLTVPKGHRLALYGPSGCGKSTLLDLLAGALEPSSGRLRVAGADLTEMSEAQRRAHRLSHIGFVFQDFPLLGYLDAVDNVLLPFRLSRSLTLDDAARARALGLLEELGLAAYARRRPDAMSQGERQRLAIARALVTEPAVLLADEPTAGLDPQRSSQILDLLQRLCSDRKLTLVLVTHDPAVLERFADQVDVSRLSHRDRR